MAVHAKGRGKEILYLSDVWIFLQTSPTSSGRRSRRLILGKFPKIRTSSPSACCTRPCRAALTCCLSCSSIGATSPAPRSHCAHSSVGPRQLWRAHSLFLTCSASSPSRCTSSSPRAPGSNCCHSLSLLAQAGRRGRWGKWVREREGYLKAWRGGERVLQDGQGERRTEGGGFSLHVHARRLTIVRRKN